MADISKLVEYDKSVEVDIKNPITGDPIGIKFFVSSSESEAVSSVNRRLHTERMQALFSSGTKEISADESAKFQEKAERESLIASISGWDWGDNEFVHINSESPCTEDNKRFVIEHPNAKWIRDQLTARATDLANFTQASAKPARSTSKK